MTKQERIQKHRKKIVDMKSARWTNGGRCLRIYFSDGTGCSVIKSGTGEYASNARVPDKWETRKEEIRKKVYAAMDRHNAIFESPYGRLINCCGVFPDVVRA